VADTKGVEAIFSWRATAGAFVAVAVSIGIALLLIDELSAPAAVRGGLIAMGALALSRLVLWAWLKSRLRR
jgi:hypothetical protein